MSNTRSLELSAKTIKDLTSLSWLAVAKEIVKGRLLKLHWGQNENEVGHTSIVIQIDKTPKFIVGYGGILSGILQTLNVGLLWLNDALAQSKTERLQARQKAASMRIAGNVRLSYYSGQNIRIRGTLLRLPLESQKQKIDAIEMLESLEKIDMGEFCMLSNNCRSYVIEVAKRLRSSINDGDWKKFEKEINELQKEDKKTLEKFLKSDRPVSDFIEF